MQALEKEEIYSKQLTDRRRFDEEKLSEDSEGRDESKRECALSFKSVVGVEEENGEEMFG